MEFTLKFVDDIIGLGRKDEKETGVNLIWNTRPWKDRGALIWLGPRWILSSEVTASGMQSRRLSGRRTGAPTWSRYSVSIFSM